MCKFEQNFLNFLPHCLIIELILTAFLNIITINWILALNKGNLTFKLYKRKENDKNESCENKH